MLTFGSGKTFAYNDPYSKEYQSSSHYGTQNDWDKHDDSKDNNDSSYDKKSSSDKNRSEKRAEHSDYDTDKKKDYESDKDKSNLNTSDYNKSHEKSYERKSHTSYNYNGYDSRKYADNEKSHDNSTSAYDTKDYSKDSEHHTEYDNKHMKSNDAHSDHYDKKDGHGDKADKYSKSDNTDYSDRNKYSKKVAYEKKDEKETGNSWHQDKKHNHDSYSQKSSYDYNKPYDKDDCEEPSHSHSHSLTSAHHSSYKPHYSENDHKDYSSKYSHSKAGYTKHYEPSHKSVRYANWKDGHSMDESERELATTLRSNLQEHAAVVVPALRAQIDQTSDRDAALAAVDMNTEAVSHAVDTMYEGSKDEFSDLWQTHIDAYLMAAHAARNNDSDAKQEANTRLATFASDAADWFVEKNDNYDADTLHEMFTTHGNQTVGLVEKLAAKDYEGVYKAAHDGYMHMGKIADYLSKHYYSGGKHTNHKEARDDMEMHRSTMFMM